MMLWEESVFFRHREDGSKNFRKILKVFGWKAVRNGKKQQPLSFRRVYRRGTAGENGGGLPSLRV